MDTSQEILLSTDSILDLQRILQDQKVVQLLLIEGGNTIANFIGINQKTGVLSLGKYRYAWLNWLFGGTYKMSFTDLCWKLIKILSCNPGDSIEWRRKKLEGATKDFFESMFLREDYNHMVRTLFIIFYIGYKNNEELAKDPTKTPLDFIEFDNNSHTAVININGVLCGDGFGNTAVIDESGRLYKIRG